MLRFKVAMLGLASLLMFGNRPEPLDDPAALQGEWEIVSVTRGGFLDPAPVGHTVRFSGNEVYFEAVDLSILPRFEEANRRIPS